MVKDRVKEDYGGGAKVQATSESCLWNGGDYQPRVRKGEASRKRTKGKSQDTGDSHPVAEIAGRQEQTGEEWVPAHRMGQGNRPFVETT